MWELIYVHFYNWDRPLDLVLVVYDLIELIIEASLWIKDYSTFDTHTQHTRLLFIECLFHLYDCTCSNVMCILNCLSIKPKKIFEYFVCFWKCFWKSFYAFVFFFLFFFFFVFFFFFFVMFIKNFFRGIFKRSSRLSTSHENGLRQNMKTHISNRNFCNCLATISWVKSTRKKFCALEAFFVSNFVRS